MSTPDGDVAIEDLKPGDTVFAYNFDSASVTQRKVLKTFKHFTYYWIDIQIGECSITATRFHKFWVESERAWIDAIDLEPDMVILLQDGSTSTVSSVSMRELENPENTYNLLVDVDHDYFVGVGHVLVHNGVTEIDPSKIQSPPPKPGLAPIGTDGYPLELHHVDQTAGSDLVEMTRTEHRLGDNFSKNHSNTGKAASEIPRNEFNKIRNEHWKQRFPGGC